MRKLRAYAAAILLYAFLLITPTAFADYDNSTYGSCAYGSTCGTSSSSSGGSSNSSGSSSADTANTETVATLPSGLEVSINLHDGQVIPRSGYVIVVTPLNGRGESFKIVSIAIGTNTPTTAAPNETGTASWQWLPEHMSGTHIVIVVTGQDGRTITETFDVRLASNVSALAPAAAAAPTVGGLSGGIKQFFGRLPRPVVYSFPFLIFILLAADILLLLVQTSRELAELRAVRRRLKRVQLMSEMKHTFNALASHYLRTPLTLIDGGIDEMNSNDVSLRLILARLQTNVTQLVQTAVSETPEPTRLFTPRPWAQLALWLPLVCAVGLVGLFDYLAEDIASISFGRVDLLTQLVTFALLALGLYVALRFVRLRHRDVDEAHQLIAQARRQLAAQEAFVGETVASLNVDFEQLKATIARAPASQAKTFANEGMSRLEEMLDKLTIATHLRGARSPAAYAPTNLQRIIAQAWQPLAESAKDKGILLSPFADASFACQDAELFTLVCRHILDNAVAYAEPGTGITITPREQKQRFELSVADHGAGIPAEKLAWLTTPFNKSEGAETFNHEGMGFSLYLDKLILAYFGGTVTIASEPYEGTTVTLRLSQQPSSVQGFERGTETSQMPWPSAASTAHAAPMVASDEVNS
jgi:signal transduction histidine kinase